MRRVAVLLVLVMSFGLLSAPPAGAWQAGASVFNTPPPWGTQSQAYQIIKHVEAAIRGVPESSGVNPPVILVTTFLLDRKKSIDELIAACRRGASVRVIIDKGIETAGSVRLARALNGDNVTADKPVPETGPCGAPLTTRTADSPALKKQATDGTPQLTEREAVQSIQARIANDGTWGTDNSYLTQCKGSCRGGPGSMHTKFYAFSRTGASSNVVMVSSSNLNKGGAVKGWNDLYTMKDVPATFDLYERIHYEMSRDRDVAGSYAEVKEGPFTSRFFPMENGSKANDPILDDLNKIRCGSDFGRTKINIAMFYWQGVRGNYLLDRILSLARSGCRVNIIIGAPSRDIAKRMRVASRARLIKVWDSRLFTKKRVLRVRTHNKYVAIKGTFGGDRSAHVVMTGSQNWGHGSLDKSDDSTLRIDLPSAYTRYVNHWGKLRRHSIRMAPPR